MRTTLTINARAWSFLAIEGVRQYGGNTGYDDDPSAVYRYDDDVANHRGVRKGDVVIVRSRDAVLGIATIEQLIEGAGQKVRQRCPECQSVNIKARISREPRWRCKQGHLFNYPIEELVNVRTFEAHYGKNFTRCPPDLTVDRLGAAVIRPSDQMSIKEIDLARLEYWLLRDAGTHAILLQFAAKLNIEEWPDLSGHGQSSIIEERRRVLREIALRRGQARFRDRLIKRYGARCQISLCDFSGLIEAAHIKPYALSNDNSEGNGLLLRSDLHTLFDLGLLAVDPESLLIALHPETLSAGYKSFEAVNLSINGTNGPDKTALTERWEFFQMTLARGSA